MKKFAVIGNPIEQSLSPALHNWIFNKLNIHAKYEKIKVDIEGLSDIISEVSSRKLDGLNITIPHKENIIKFVDDVNVRCETIGSINCVIKSNSKIIGYNTDWYGFVKSLEINHIDVYGKEIIVIGAGATGKSILYSLKHLGVKKILLFNRTLRKAEKLQDNIIYPSSLDQIDNFIKNDSIIINTTSLGMKVQQSPVKIELMHQNQTIIDVIYNPTVTPMLKLGNEVGAKTLNGLDMFIVQGLTSLDLWFGESISKQVNFTQLKSYLETHLC